MPRVIIGEGLMTLTTRTLGVLAGSLLLAMSFPSGASTEPINFKLLTGQSYATFKSDAPLETIVGHTADAGLNATLTVDPDKPQAATGVVKVDMNAVRTGLEKRDADMRGKAYLDTDVEANRWVSFEVKKVEIAGALEPGKPVPAKVHGILTIKQRGVSRTADATVTYIKFTPEQAEAQKRFGFTTDNLKVRAKLDTTFTDHGMQVPQLLILKVSNNIAIETDLVFVRQ